MKGPWTRTQDVLLRKLWAYAEMRNLVWTLRKTEAAIRNRAHTLGLHGRYANRKPYSAAERKMLRKLFPRMSSFKVAKRMKRSVCSVNGMAHKFGLYKTEKYLASPDACRLRRENNGGEPFRFRPGHVPANKGLRRPGYAPGRMAETQFKKGQRTGAANSNWRPIGTVVFNTDGYLIRKVADEPNAGVGATNRNWEFERGLRRGYVAHDIKELRKHLFETIEGLKSEEKPMDIDRAKAISQVAQTIIDSARVEVKFAELTGQETQSDFLAEKKQPRPNNQLPERTVPAKGLSTGKSLGTEAKNE